MFRNRGELSGDDFNVDLREESCVEGEVTFMIHSDAIVSFATSGFVEATIEVEEVALVFSLAKEVCEVSNDSEYMLLPNLTDKLISTWIWSLLLRRLSLSLLFHLWRVS